MSFDLDTLYKLLPAIYRIRDLEQLSGDTSLLGQDQPVDMQRPALPLLALMKVLGEQIAVIEENLAQLYDDQFIETCAEWVIPYIGDLVGYQLPHDTSSQSLRSEVANTIHYRKRKGTVTLLEQLVRDVTGWDAHVVEYFQLLATEQHMQRLRPDNRLIDVRQAIPPELLHVPAPFEQFPHTIDTRNISTGSGAYNIENIGIFIWRLNAYRLSNVPVVEAPVSDRNRYLYLLDPLGNDTQLFTHPRHDEEVTQLAGPLAVAAPITRDMLARAFSDYYGQEKSLWLTVTDTSGGTAIDKVILPDPLSELVGTADSLYHGLTAGRLDLQRLAQLSEALYQGLTTLPNVAYRQLAQLINMSQKIQQGLISVENLNFQALASFIKQSELIATVLKALQASQSIGEPPYTFTACDLSDEIVDGRVTWKASPEDTIAIDPELGRLAFPKRRKGQRKNIEAPNNLRVTYYYGFSADMGGGEYHRAASFTPGLPVAAQLPVQIDGVQQALDIDAVQQALDALAASAVDGVVEITASGRIEGTLNITAAANQRIELRGADFTRPTPILAAKKGSPTFEISGDEGAEVILNGLVIGGGHLHVGGKLSRLALRHCTIRPELAISEDGKPLEHSKASLIFDPAQTSEVGQTTIEIDHAIVGRIENKGNTQVSISASIIDALRQDHLAYAGPVAFSPGDTALDSLSLTNCTVIGRVHTAHLELASNTLFFARHSSKGEAPVQVERRQSGCARYSYIPIGSRVPQRRYNCVPESEKDAEVLQLGFTSLSYGNPGYGQLSRRTSPAITRGADDTAEMGAFHDLFQTQRSDNLQLRLKEYLRFGFETGIFYQT
jgi:hypothetical protein